MLYLLFGPQGMILEKQCKKIIKDNLEVIDDFHVIKFMADEVTIQDIVFEADQTSLTGERKAIIVYHPYFLSTSKTKEKIESLQDYKVLMEYLESPNTFTDLIFVLEADKLNERSEIVKLLKVKAKVIEAKEITKEEWPRFIQQYFQKLNVSIDPDATSELALRVEGDAMRFVNEAKKLALYTDHITYDDIQTMIARPLEENAFLIYDCLLKKDKSKAISIYRDLLVEGSEPVQLVGMLANQFRLLSEVSYLSTQYSSNNEIARILGVHEYRVKLSRDHLRRITYKKILKKIDELYQLDLDIKSGVVDRFFAFEMFLIRF
ncbi:MAG: DNA polymerase III subunit delta [Coprobacillus sp.]|nr:DNA polymerase III subunit delta [Coprobacillus sp.]